MAFQNPPPQPPWQYSGGLGGYYIYDSQADLIKMSTGQILQRPPDVPKEALLQTTPRAPFQSPAGGSPQVNTGGQLPNGWQGQRGQAREGAQTPAQRGTYQRAPQQHPRRQSGSQQVPQYEISSGPSHDVVSPLAQMSIAAPRTQGRRRIVDSEDTEVRSGPSNQITPPDLRRQGIHSNRLVRGTDESQSSTLHPAYTIRGANFYVVGRVFFVLWSEPAGGRATSFTRGTVLNAFGERVFSKIRRFVVVRQGATSCTALRISTYGGQGVAKRGITKSHHGIIYTGRHVQQHHPSETPARRESPMQPVSILVDPDSSNNVLDPMSRINFFEVHTVQYNVKAKPLGKVNSRSLAALEQQFRNVLSLPAPASPPAQRTQRRQPADAGAEGGSDEDGSHEDGSGEGEASDGQQSE